MPQARDEAGNIWEVDAQGNAVRLIEAAAGPQGQVFDLPPDPIDQARLENERERIRIAQQNANRVGQNDDLRRDLLEAQVRAAQANAAKAERGTAGAQAGDTKTQARLANINALVDQIKRVQELYDSGPGATSGVMGVADYLPTPTNRQFDAAAAGLAEQGLAAFRVPGVGAQSDTELRQFVDANKPSASDYDAQIEEKLRQLRSRVDQTRASMGLEPADWQETRPNAMTQTRFSSGAAPMAAGAGATMTGDQYPPEMLREHDEIVRSMIGRDGALDPEAYAVARIQLNDKYGFTGDSQSDRTWAAQINDYLAKGGATIPTGIMPPVREMTEVEQFRNDLVTNPLGSAAAGAANMVGFGIPEALTGDRMNALRDLNPLSTLAGEVGGAIGGTALIGRAGAAAAGKLAPDLLGGGVKAQLGRNLATDATFGGIYGGVVEGDPVTGAASAAVGSGLGQAVGAGLGKTFRGVDLSKAAETLRNRGVPLTTGQVLGGFAKSVEDRATSIPFVGDMIGRRRMEGLEAFNREGLREAAQPIGFTPANIGKEGVQEAYEAVGNSYTDATSGVSVPLDPRYANDLTGIQGLADRLPPNAQPALDKIGENYIMPITAAGSLDGDTFQNVQRALKAKRNKPAEGALGFEQEWKDALTGIMTANRTLMERGGGQKVVDGLNRADAAYRGIKTVEDAAMRADGANYVFTPSQLQDAVKKTQRKFPGASPLADLADAGQEVLPSQIPDSGTAGRLAQMVGPGAGVAAIGGAGYAAGGSEGAQSSAMLTALALLGGTKVGQKAINAALSQRSAKAREIGRKISKRTGLFGSAAVPMMLTN